MYYEMLWPVERRRRSRRHAPKVLTDLDYADDLAIICKEMHQAQKVINRLEDEAAKVGLYCNPDTECQAYNQNQLAGNYLYARNDKELKKVTNFKCLGAGTESSEKDFSVRKALAWSVCHKLHKIWTSKISRKLRIQLFLSTVESVFLYGAETWTLTKKLAKQIDGCYTRMLRMAMNIS